MTNESESKQIRSFSQDSLVYALVMMPSKNCCCCC